jgi:hypothetical protein
MNGTSTRLGKKFTEGAVKFMRRNAGRMTATKMASVLHRTTKSVRRKAERLGLSLKVR